MEAFVFTDASLERYAGRFVWLAIDGEKESNAALRKKFALEGYPTFYVVDPRSEKVVLRWLGGATAPQLAKILDDGLRAVNPKQDLLAKKLSVADTLYGSGDNAGAAKAYAALLEDAPAAWRPRGRVTES
ncbi:MAG: thiol reductase thioredoxin, partial [Thermoanaerobaculia bacterium]